MRSIVILIVTIAAAATALATAVAVPLVYLLGWDQVNLPIIGMTSMIAVGFPFALAYGLSNTASGIADQDDPGLYWLDHIPSVLAWLSINVTAAIVLFGLFQTNQDIVRVIKETFGLQLLLGLVVFSWFDVLWLQRRKHAMLKQQLQNPNAPTPQLAAQQPTVSRGPTIFGAALATLLVLGLIGGAIYASRQGLVGTSTAELGKSGCTEKYIGTNAQGTKMYELPADCGK